MTTADGTQQVISVTVNGRNDTAVISGTSTGSVIESSGIANATAGTATATGTLTDTDVDNTANTFTAVASAIASAGGYGTYTMTAGGVWTYNLNNANSTVQALNVGQSLSDSFTVATSDGTQQLVTVIINGANDSPTLSLSSSTTHVYQGALNLDGSVIQASATDIDGTVASYSLSGVHASLFSISSGGVITLKTDGAHELALSPNDDWSLDVTAIDNRSGVSNSQHLNVAVTLAVSQDGLHGLLPGSIGDWVFKPLAVDISSAQDGSHIVGNGFLMTSKADAALQINFSSTVQDVKFSSDMNGIYTLNNNGSRATITDAYSSSHTIVVSQDSIESLDVYLQSQGSQTVVGAANTMTSTLGDSVNFREDVVHINSSLSSAAFNADTTNSHVLLTLNGQAANTKTLSGVEVVQFSDALVRLIGADGYSAASATPLAGSSLAAILDQAFNSPSTTHSPTMREYYYLASNGNGTLHDAGFGGDVYHY